MRPPGREGAWRERRPGGRARRAWGVGFLAGFGLWLFAVHEFFEDRGSQDFLAGNKPTFALIAAVTYWPVAMLVWYRLYPGSGRVLPWADDD